MAKAAETQQKLMDRVQQDMTAATHECMRKFTETQDRMELICQNQFRESQEVRLQSTLSLLYLPFHFSAKSHWLKYNICRNKRPGHLIFESSKIISKAHHNPLVLCTPPFEKSPIKSHRFHVLPPLKNHPSQPIGFVYSPLWKITHQSPLVLCTPPFEKSFFLVGAYFGKYGSLKQGCLNGIFDRCSVPPAVNCRPSPSGSHYKAPANQVKHPTEFLSLFLSSSIIHLISYFKLFFIFKKNVFVSSLKLKNTHVHFKPLNGCKFCA